MTITSFLKKKTDEFIESSKENYQKNKLLRASANDEYNKEMYKENLRLAREKARIETDFKIKQLKNRYNPPVNRGYSSPVGSGSLFGPGPGLPKGYSLIGSGFGSGLGPKPKTTVKRKRRKFKRYSRPQIVYLR
jgi:hypothetical protein